MPDEFDTRVGAYCVVVNHDRILLAHIRKDWFGADYGWTLPGGGMEAGETPQESARREMLEETGLEVTLTGLLTVDSFTVQAKDRIDESRRDRQLLSLRILYTAEIIGGELRPEVDGSTDAVGWLGLEQVRTVERVELVDVALDALRLRV